jgi:predicted DNA-binding protein
MRINDDLKQHLKRYAEQDGRTMSNLVKYLVDRYIKEHDWQTDVLSKETEGRKDARRTGKKIRKSIN